MHLKDYILCPCISRDAQSLSHTVDCYDVTVNLNSQPDFSLRTVFLDRDGVLNQKMPEGQYVSRWQDFHLLPDVPESIRILNAAGVSVIVVSNQRGIALGLYSPEDVSQIHDSFQASLKANGAHVDAFYFCPHDRDQCNCRKPLPGMFEQARADFPDIDPRSSLMVGDSKSDIEFGKRLGMTTAFIQSSYDERKSDSQTAQALADFVFSSLYDCVRFFFAKPESVEL